MDTLEFFDMIYGDAEGYIPIATLSDLPNEDGVRTLSSEKWFAWPHARDNVRRYVQVRDDEDVYNSVAVFSDKQRTGSDRDARARVVYVDADTCQPSKFRIPPSIAVQTSEDKWHCYWLLDHDVPAYEASRVSRRICYAHAKDGCDHGYQVSKLLRVPNTSNTKYETPFKVVAHTTGVVYTLEEIESAYDDVTDSHDTQVNSDIPETIVGAAYIELETRLDSAGLSSLYLEVPREGQSWSSRAYALEQSLFRAGMTLQEVFSLMRNAACNKYDPEAAGQRTATGVLIPERANPDLVLWQEIQKAYAEFQEGDVVRTEPTKAGASAHNRREFITLDERKKVMDNPTFVQQYVDWMAERSDSPEVYQRSLAYVILSACLSGRGKISTPHGTFGLNLWMLGVGESTLDRKSTALNSALAIIRGFEDQMALSVPIDIGSDFTKEGVIKELAVDTRNHKSALIHIDEVNGFFSEVFQKSYRAGTLETLTALYGGDVPKSMRSNKDDNTPLNMHTHLNFIGFGIESKVSSLLTNEHFESGFLARMLWAVADEPKRKKNANAMVFLDEVTTKKKFDKSRLRVIRSIQSAARKFSENPDRIIGFDSDAAERLNEWIETATTIFMTHEQKSLISAAVVRMFTSAAKACALLAMYEGRDRVQMIDVLHVLAQCELWFRDLERMARNISNSDYEKKLAEVYEHILGQPNSTLLESSLRKKFARYRGSEFDDMLNSLKKQGRIRRSADMAQGIEAIPE